MKFTKKKMKIQIQYNYKKKKLNFFFYILYNILLYKNMTILFYFNKIKIISKEK